MKLLLENLKLCWGMHDMLLPMVIRVYVNLPNQWISFFWVDCVKIQAVWSKCVHHRGETSTESSPDWGVYTVSEWEGTHWGVCKSVCGWKRRRRRLGKGAVSKSSHLLGISRLITKAEVPRFTPIGDKWHSFQCFEGHRERMWRSEWSLMASIKTQACLNSN